MTYFPPDPETKQHQNLQNQNDQPTKRESETPLKTFDVPNPIPDPGGTEYKKTEQSANKE